MCFEGIKHLFHSLLLYFLNFSFDYYTYSSFCFYLRQKLLSVSLFVLLPGGGVLLVEAMLFENRRGPIMTQLFSLNMLVQTKGRERPPSEYTHMFNKTGFKNIQVCRTGKSYDAILAIRWAQTESGMLRKHLSKVWERLNGNFKASIRNRCQHQTVNCGEKKKSCPHGSPVYVIVNTNYLLFLRFFLQFTLSFDHTSG